MTERQIQEARTLRGRFAGTNTNAKEKALKHRNGQ